MKGLMFEKVVDEAKKHYEKPNTFNEKAEL